MSYRTTISIPDDLKEQMDAIGDRVNWSAVAAQAFRAKVFEIQARKGTKMKKADIVKRMKAAQEADTEDYDDGKQAGREWAASQATPKALRRLTAYMQKYDHEPMGHDWWDVGSPHWNAPWGAVDNITFAIRPKLKEDQDEQGIRSFWEEVLGDETAHYIQDSDFLHGFGDGAREVWEEVSDEL
jgi:hypothetical protein